MPPEVIADLFGMDEDFPNEPRVRVEFGEERQAIYWGEPIESWPMKTV